MPNKIQIASSTFQLTFKERCHLNMEGRNPLEILLDRASRELFLQPNEVTAHNVVDGFSILQRGDHIVVYDGMVQHHGIYLGVTDNHRMVMDNSSQKCDNGKSIQCRRLGDFLKIRRKFLIVKCKCPADEKEL